MSEDREFVKQNTPCRECAGIVYHKEGCSSLAPAYVDEGPWGKPFRTHGFSYGVIHDNPTGLKQ